MLYMKEMRPKIAAECTLKESAAINQILGKRVSFVSYVLAKLSSKGLGLKFSHHLQARVTVSLKSLWFCLK